MYSRARRLRDATDRLAKMGAMSDKQSLERIKHVTPSKRGTFGYLSGPGVLKEVFYKHRGERRKELEGD